MIENVGDVLRLVWRTRLNHATPGLDIDGLTVLRHAFGALFQHPCLFDGQMNLFRFNILNLSAHRRSIDVQAAQDIGCRVHAYHAPGQFKVIVTAINFDA